MAGAEPRTMRYFDHNAAGPLAPEARRAWLETAERFPANPSSPHREGDRAAAALETARRRLAERLGCRALDLVWTSGATEANNAVLHHLARIADPAAKVWLSAVEHPSVIEAARRWFPQRHEWIPVNAAGVVELDWLAERLRRSRPAAVAVMAANNVTGVLQPWREVRELCRQHEAPCFCDAVQWLGREPAAGLGELDFVAGCLHKAGGPRGIGFLKCPERGGFHGLVVGGPQERGRRAGTENPPAAAGLSAQLAAREDALAPAAVEARRRWRDGFEAGVRSVLPSVRVLGEAAPRLWNTSTLLMPRIECPQRWLVKLDKAGFAASNGSACASGREKASHVVTAMGLSAGEAGGVLRFSSGWETTEADWQALAEALIEVAGTLLAPGGAGRKGN